VTVGITLFGAAVALAVVGILMIISHFVRPPPRYGEPIRMGPEVLPRPGMGRLLLGVVLIFVAAGLVTAATFFAGH